MLIAKMDPRNFQKSEGKKTLVLQYPHDFRRFEFKIDFGYDFDANLVPFWKDFGCPGRVWALLGASWRPLGASWTFLGASEGHLETP